MSILWQQVIDIAPELSAVNENSQQQILSVVDAQVDDAAWGDLADTGRAYLAAHLATVGPMRKGISSGPVTMETLGPFSRSYGSLAAGGTLASTAYGVEYERMLHLLPTALGAVF